jgi:ribonuclease G
MNIEILINKTAREVRAALLEDGAVQEVFIERAENTRSLGNIYRGRVVRVLPGMQAAFLDIGLERTAFLHAADMQRTVDREETPDIRELVREGDELTVQVVKEPLGTKGARLSGDITFPSRYLVLLPNRPGVAISSRIDDEAERERLLQMAANTFSTGPHGCILRTAAEGVTEDVLRADMEFVIRQWEAVGRKNASRSGVQLLHAELPLALCVVRDCAGQGPVRLQADSEPVLKELRGFVDEFMPEQPINLEFYTGQRPIFDLHNVDEEIDRALNHKVDLQSGGYLIVEQTEAMTTIDVNTGAFVGRTNLEETIFRTNLEAAAAIARQLRLRNLGGIIIIDFIDMQAEIHRQQVLEALEAAMVRDRARTRISSTSQLGLIEMTRKRNRESLEHILCEPCPACEGRGHVKSAATVCYEIFREILRQHRQFPSGELAVLAHDVVVEMLLEEESSGIAELEQLTGRALRLQAQAMSAPDEFDVIPM